MTAERDVHLAFRISLPPRVVLVLCSERRLKNSAEERVLGDHLRPKVLQDFREGIYTKYDEGHTSVVGLQYPNVDQSSRVQLDFNPADTVCGL